MVHNTTYNRVRPIAPLLAIGAAAGIGASIFNTNSTNDANRDIMRQQNEWNEKLWHMNNAYNTPLAQRQRMEAAGLNPNLFDMESGVSSSPAEAAPPAQMLPNNMPAEILSNLALQQSQTNLNNANAGKSESETDLNEIEKKFRADILSGVVSNQNVTLSNILANTELTKAQANEFRAKFDLLSKEIATYDERTKAFLDKNAAEIGLLEKQQTTETAKQDQIAAETANTQEQTRWIAPQASANISASRASAAESRANAAYRREETKFFKITSTDRADTIHEQYKLALEEWRRQMMDNDITQATIQFEIDGRLYRMETDKANMRTAVTTADMAESDRVSVEKVKKDLGYMADYAAFANRYGFKISDWTRWNIDAEAYSFDVKHRAGVE